METNCVQQVKPLASRFSGVLLDECGELGSGKVLEQLIEQACDLYDWIALLWAAFGEAPAKEWLANVNFRRALILFQTARTCFGQEFPCPSPRRKRPPFCQWLESSGPIFLRPPPPITWEGSTETLHRRLT
jgi:hypothetical protein